MEIGLLAKVGAGVVGVAGVGVGGCYAAGLMGGGGSGADANASDPSGQTSIGSNKPQETVGGPSASAPAGDSGERSVDGGGSVQTDPAQQYRAQIEKIQKDAKDKWWTYSKDYTISQIVYSDKASATWSPVATDSKKYAEGTLGQMYGRYLIGTFGNGSNDTHQQEKWEEIYKSVEDQITDAKSVKFKENSLSVNQAYSASNASSSSNPTALNVACSRMYDLKLNEEDNGQQKKIVEDLLMYCSPLGMKPERLRKTPAPFAQEWSSVSNHNLVKSEDDNQKLFWELQDRWFRSLRGKTGEEVTDEFFKPYLHVTDDTIVAVRMACHDAYQLAADSTAKPTWESLVKYCSFP